jgi:hypothetical protein
MDASELKTGIHSKLPRFFWRVSPHMEYPKDMYFIIFDSVGDQIRKGFHHDFPSSHHPAGPAQSRICHQQVY